MLVETPGTTFKYFFERRTIHACIPSLKILPDVAEFQIYFRQLFSLTVLKLFSQLIIYLNMLSVLVTHFQSYSYRISPFWNVCNKTGSLFVVFVHWEERWIITTNSVAKAVSMTRGSSSLQVYDLTMALKLESSFVSIARFPRPSSVLGIFPWSVLEVQILCILTIALFFLCF